jgi:transcriptional regulator with XRE-family HTH domain
MDGRWWSDKSQLHAGSSNFFKGMENIGSRLVILRQRYGLSLHEVSRRTGLSYTLLSDLERDPETLQQVAPGTVHIVLDGIGVSEQERRATFYRESPPLPPQWLAEEVSKAAALVEHAHRPVGLLDEQRRWAYLNRAARLLFAFTAEEYLRLLGTHMLQDIFDPSAAMYSRYPDEMRRIYLSWKALAFKIHFADQQFCKWYLDIEALVATVDWARRIWNKPQVLPTLVDSHDVIILHPEVGEIHVRDQVNEQMMSRCPIVEWTPTDELSAAKMDAVVSRPYWLRPEKVDNERSAAEEQSVVYARKVLRTEATRALSIPARQPSRDSNNLSDARTREGFLESLVDGGPLLPLCREKKASVH